MGERIPSSDSNRGASWRLRIQQDIWVAAHAGTTHGYDMGYDMGQHTGDHIDAPRGTPALSANALICVVDDDAAVRHALENLLRSAGFVPIGFESAESCLASPRRADFVFAILDIELSGMDGFDLQRHLQIGGALPLVFLSAHGDRLSQRRALEAGAIALLRKPVDVEHLLTLIARALAAPERPA